METKPRIPPSAPIAGRPLRIESTVTAEELATAAGITPLVLERLVRAGFIAATEPSGETFDAAAAVRLTRMLRLHRDLGIGLTSASIIVDLLERLELQDARLARRRGGR